MYFTNEELELLDDNTRSKILSLKQELDNVKQSAQEYEKIKQRIAENYLIPQNRQKIKEVAQLIDPVMAQQLPNEVPQVDGLINPINEKLKEVDELRNQISKDKAEVKLKEIFEYYNIPDTKEQAEKIHKFMKENGITNVFKGVELYAKTDWLVEQESKPYRSTLDEKIKSPEEILQMSESDFRNKLIEDVKQIIRR
ncbi:MAG: hypothetical protein QXI16_03400 [Sulfolobaceae archaeon]